MTMSYSYQEIKNRLEAQKQQLVEKLETSSITESERQDIQLTIDNYQYILDLADMNYYERGFQR
ncbi:DUF3896 family protein [Ectobacillus sp. sgz5001026]|uniref:DUF3896 family protein n=1 Tax=Ectobacillus sp. sgz5001026 TaxID=3242473 RepID=UPI0036D2A4F7